MEISQNSAFSLLFYWSTGTWVYANFIYIIIYVFLQTGIWADCLKLFTCTLLILVEAQVMADAATFATEIRKHKASDQTVIGRMLTSWVINHYTGDQIWNFYRKMIGGDVYEIRKETLLLL